MSSASVSGGSGISKRPVVIVLGIIGLVAVVVGVLYFVAGSSLPSFMVAGSHVKHGGHYIRGGVALAAGLVVLGGAWLMGRKK